MKAVSAEFALCVECCRWSFARDKAHAVQALCATVDWSRFTRLARLHRIQGLVWNCLFLTGAEVSAEAAEMLSSDAQTIAAANLQMAVEANHLCRDFRAADIALTFVKGLTLGALAYPQPFSKMGWDIDLLIDSKQLVLAVELLRARGYEQIVPRQSEDLKSWHKSQKESVWMLNKELYVELHTRLADNRHMIPQIGVHSPCREVQVAPGITLPTLERDELFAYLCVHGASSNWFRLKWITDFAAMLHLETDLESLFARSQELGAHRAAGQALLLADRLYGTLDQSPLRSLLRGDRANCWLARAAIRQLAGSSELREPTSKPFGTWRIHLTQLLLKPGVGFKFNELSRQIGNASFWPHLRPN